MRHFKSLHELARASGVEPPKHPLVGLLRITDHTVLNNEAFTTDFYKIGFKKIKAGYMLYGRTRFDHETGSMMFVTGYSKRISIMV